jgi:hypothetical protein
MWYGIVSPEVALAIITSRHSTQTSLTTISPCKTKASNQNVSKRKNIVETSKNLLHAIVTQESKLSVIWASPGQLNLHHNKGRTRLSNLESRDPI